MRANLLLALVAAGLIVTACASRQSDGTASPTTTPARGGSVAVATVTTATIDRTLSATGNVRAADEVSVIPKQPGRIVKLAVEVGTAVKAGDVIAQLDHATLDLNLENAQASFDSAQAKLSTVQAGPRPESVRTAELGVSSAQSRLQSMLDGPLPATIAQSRAALDSAKQKLAAMQDGGAATSIAQAQAILNGSLAKQQALKNGLTPGQIAALELAISQAKNSLYAAQISRDATCAHTGAACDAANATVNAAQTGVDQAQSNLKSQTAPPTQTDLQQAQAAVDQAQAALNAAQKPYSAHDLQQAQDAVTQAEASLTLALHPVTEPDLQQQRNAVSAAQQALSLARQPYTDQDLQSARAGVGQAQVAVNQARQAIDDATVKAPVSGTITQKTLSEGALASTASSLATIASSALKVQIPVEETQVLYLKPGQVATLSVSALGDQVITGKVTNVAPSGDSKSRTFVAEITPDKSSELLAGMFVKVTINTQEHRDVTAVPTGAIVDRDGTSYVFVVQNAVAHEVAVDTGLTNAQLTEITKGVSAGQSVVVQGQTGLTDGDHVTVQTGANG